MTSPTSPIALAGSAARLAAAPAVDPAFIQSLCEVCEVVTDHAAAAEASRDWWPLAMHWALAGMVPHPASAVARPVDTAQVSQLLERCNAAGVPVTPAGGRSSVVGGAAPVRGGVLLDLTAMQGVVSIDVESGIVEVLPGTFGPDLERAVRAEGLTVGHYPQSFDISTVGGWVAARGAGQYSTRYGKIEHMVHGLEVVLADGTIVRTGGSPAAAVGPDLTQVFIGSEGTLGVVTRVWLRAHPLPAAERRSAWAFPGPAGFTDGIEACRRVLRRGATPAVLRLYDAAESARGQGADGSYCVLLVLDEGDPAIVDATMSIVGDECAALGALPLGDDLVERWMHHRNDTSALQALTTKGFVVDTLEIAAPWSRLGEVVASTTAALLEVPHARAATCHLSHSYLDGACLYFTFAATPPAAAIESTYVAMWDAGQRAVLAAGGNLSHHHGVGLNRARFVHEALGDASKVLVSLKRALDPAGILNPGKLGFPADQEVWP